MIAEITRQLSDPEIRDGNKEPDYNACVTISTKASLRKMVMPGVLVIGSPIVFGILLGPAAVCGLLAGNIVSGV